MVELYVECMNREAGEPERLRSILVTTPVWIAGDKGNDVLATRVVQMVDFGGAALAFQHFLTYRQTRMKSTGQVTATYKIQVLLHQRVKRRAHVPDSPQTLVTNARVTLTNSGAVSRTSKRHTLRGKANPN